MPATTEPWAFTHTYNQQQEENNTLLPPHRSFFITQLVPSHPSLSLPSPTASSCTAQPNAACTLLSPLAFASMPLEEVTRSAHKIMVETEEVSFVHRAIVMMGLGDVFDEARRMTKRQVSSVSFSFNRAAATPYNLLPLLDTSICVAGVCVWAGRR
jgi:hypothetical protein